MMSSSPTAISEAELAAWYAEKTFTCDWTSGNFPVWIDVLAPLRDRAAQVLEIGSWEGRSALFFLNYFPNAKVSCIDTFGGNAEHHEDAWFAALVPEIESHFDRNLAAFGARVEKLKGPSARVLPELGIAGRRFDVAYVDGSHFAADVYSDAALTWSLMSPGGIVIFDDYNWDLMDEERERPKLGVDAFLQTIAGQYRVVHCDYQMLIEKL